MLWTGHKRGIALLVTMAYFLASGGCSQEQKSPVSREKVTIAVSPQPVSAPIYVAYAKGFFEHEGLEVFLRSYTSGKDALNAVIEGKADFGTTAETPVMYAGLRGEKIYVVATLADSDKYMKIVARKDRGISATSDLKDKLIGVSPGTNGEFFLHVYLALNHLTQKDVRIVGIRPDDMVDALTTGRVDAVSTWAPHTTVLRNKLGDDALIIQDPGVYVMTWNVAAARDFVKSRPGCVEKFLRAVSRANEFIEEHPGEARSITADHIGMDMVILDEIWGLYNFNTVLDQSLILNLEDQARWSIKREAVAPRKTPDYMDFIYTAGLKSIRPEAVRIPGSNEGEE